MYIELAAHRSFTFRPMTQARDIVVEKGRAVGLVLETRGQTAEKVYADRIVAAPGRAGAKWLTERCQKLGLETVNNEVDIGVRVEVPNAVMDHLTRHLYEAKLVYYSDTFESKVRTFCCILYTSRCV